MQRFGRDARKPLRPFVHAEIGAHAVPGAMVEVEPRLPERPAREGIQVHAREALGKAQPGNGDHALEDARETGAFLRPRLAHGKRAGDVRRSVEILPAAVQHDQVAVLKLPVAVVAHAVMGQGAVRPRPADRVERNVAQRVGVAAETLKLGDDVDLGQAALVGRVEPGQQAAHGGCVAQMRLAGAGDLGRVLAGLGQDARILTARDLGPRLGQGLAHGDGAGARVDPHRVGQAGEQGDEIRRRVDAHAGAQMHVQIVVHLFRGGQQIDRGVVV